MVTIMVKSLPSEVKELVNLLDTATNWLKTRDFAHHMLSNSDRRVLVEKLQDIIVATQSLKYL